jgi:hypothetical protein
MVDSRRVTVAGPAAGFQVTGELFDISPPDSEQGLASGLGTSW